ncbi:hypothetical protein ATK74_2898 [Propionicimonas paludicola]|uniref:Uncharacterized protein n=1 Tax=Propionicimonas paludicola TaxID=185243 RepID=A0A2A9CV68_9ACTN|nr:hypothetical protein [Propionicimonas paludicola]PFG18314.1 hypothetical protein ATK74_2898 [Propionicimonas paludicola]
MATRVVQWREAVDPADLREYDAFGPWIYPVRSAAELPRRFRRYWADLAYAELLLKIPRDRDRSQIQPGDDLYHSVLAVFPERLQVLRAEVPDAGEVERLDVRFTEVVGVVTTANLLQGQWTLLLRNGRRLDVPHPATGGDVMEQVSDLIRPRISGPERRLPTTGQLQPRDHLFGVHLAALADRFGSALALHVDPRKAPCRGGFGWPKVSTGTMIVFTPTELVIVNRGEAARPVFMPNYEVGTVELPYSRLESFAVRPPARWSSFHQLVLRSGMQDYVQLCLNPPDAVAAQLRLLEFLEDI